MNAPARCNCISNAFDTVAGARRGATCPLSGSRCFEGLSRSNGFASSTSMILPKRAPWRICRGGAAVALAIRRPSVRRASRKVPPCLSPTVAEDGWASRHSVIQNRQRRHAVPRRLDDDRDQPSGTHAASESCIRRSPWSETPAAGSRRFAPRLRGRRDSGRESWIHIEVDRLVDDLAARPSWSPASSACSEMCRAAVGRLESDGHAPARGDRRDSMLQSASFAEGTCRREAAHSCNGCPTGHLTMLGYRQARSRHRQRRKTGCGLVPRQPASACLRREPWQRRSSASFAAFAARGARNFARAVLPLAGRDQGQYAFDRPSARL